MGDFARAICKPFENQIQNCERNLRYPNVDMNHMGTKKTSFKKRNNISIGGGGGRKSAMFYGQSQPCPPNVIVPMK